MSINGVFNGIPIDVRPPDECPVCHRAIAIRESLASISVKAEARIIFQCPAENCQELFIGYYRILERLRGRKEWGIRNPVIYRIVPSFPPKEIFPDVIHAISPQFEVIFNQANLARELGLDQVAGPGYRKAFEFLIKDYAQSKANSDQQKERIRKSFSGDVVKHQISDARIKALSERTLWLGNDESHYLRKWGEKDITDLVSLIKMTMHFIGLDHEANAIIADMPEGR